MSNDIPEWALNRAAELAGHKYASGLRNFDVIEESFARYIAEHEEPPVDPLLIEAREIAATHAEKQDYKMDFIANIRSGNWDNDDEVQVPLAALKRGIEMGKGEQ